MATIGEIFREARNRKGVTEEVAAKAIKIKIERLRDLEENRYESFPAYVYLRGFLKHYADYLGIDSQPVLQQFSEKYPAPEQKPIFEIIEEQHFHCPIHRHVPSSASTFWLTPTGKMMTLISFVILLVAAACFWWVSRDYATHTPNSEPSATKSPPPSSDPEISETMDESWKIPISPGLTPGTNSPPARTGPQL